MTGQAPTAGAEVPLVLALDDPGAVPGVVGGKGASLGRLVRAGVRVPAGFHVTTAAYVDFLSGGGLREELMAAASLVDASDGSDAVTSQAAAARIGELFAAQPVPASTAAAIARAYASLGHDDVPVAVRSSATVEDLPGLSAAGQHDTYLNVRGEAAVIDAVRRCWSSLWSARAIGYRARRGISPGDVSIAVVVQRLVPAEAAGVMFTIDPVSGAADQVVVSANWGLGESVVAGDVTPDVAVVDRASGALVSYQLGGKAVMTVTDGTGTLETETPAGLRSTPVLSPAQAGELGRVGVSIEKLYGEPVDVEWARAGGELWVVQARPITARAARSAVSAGVGDQWNDSLAGDYLWTNGNLGEALPDVMTPATWSFIELFMGRMIFPPSVPGYPGYGRIGGRFYANVSVSMSLEALIGISSRRFVALFGPVLGRLPALEEIPRAHLPRWKTSRLMVPVTFAMVRRVNANAKRMPQFLADSPTRCDRLRADIEQTADAAALADLWPAKVRPLLVEAADMLAAAGSADGTTLVSAPGKLATLVGEADAALLLSGQQAEEALSLASLGPVLGLARLARGEIDRNAFAGQYGHRSAHEVELSIPRPAEDPAWLDDQLAALHGADRDPLRDADALLARQQEARAAAWERLARSDPWKATAARKLIMRWAPLACGREAARSEVVRSVWVARTWVRRAGEVTGLGDDLFFLELPEIYRLLRGEHAPLEQVPGRRAVYEGYRALPSYPALIRGRFDPARWAADPHRRVDYYDEQAAAVQTTTGPDDAITGFPGAAGVVEGTARVLCTPEDGVRFGDGEILVTTVTNIGWTPIFPRAAAVVTDVGAPLSHAAIVARELGIPAVVGCGDATTRLHSGDRVRVDGGAGTVEILNRV
jgi:rifampicin phosphotransferase